MSVSQLLSYAEKDWYIEKILGGVDPYEIPKTEWTEDKEILPAIT